MRIKHFLFFLPIIFTSCYFKNFEAIKVNNLNERVFENSAEGKILDGDNNIQAYVKAIYVSDINPTFQNDDVFLFSFYFFDKKVQGLSNINYSLRMNGIRPYKIEEIPQDSKIIHQVKLLNPWCNNYIIYFKKVQTDKFKIKFNYKDFRALKLNILKGRGELRFYPTLQEKLIQSQKEQ